MGLGVRGIPGTGRCWPDDPRSLESPTVTHVEGSVARSHIQAGSVVSALCNLEVLCYSSNVFEFFFRYMSCY